MTAAPPDDAPDLPPAVTLRARYVLGFWTGIALFWVLREVAMKLANGEPFDWAGMLVEPFVDSYLWAAYTFLIFALAGRVRFTRRRWAGPALAHFVAAVALSWGSVSVNWLVLAWRYERTAGYWAFVAFALNFSVVWYILILAARYGLESHARFREREVRAARLSAQLAQAQLEALKMQIQPHFLFNTLHSISELIHEDPDAADRMVARLGDLLRRTVDAAGTQEVPLRREREFLEAYLEIQRTRFHDTLRVHLDLPPETEDARVPNLVLQPLVENAIRHGTARRAGAGTIEVRARVEAGRLHLEVRDDGPGPQAASPARRAGVGLANTRARLAQLYGAAASLALEAAPGGGTVARIELPYRPAPPEPALRAETLDPAEVGR